VSRIYFCGDTFWRTRNGDGPLDAMMPVLAGHHVVLNLETALAGGRAKRKYANLQVEKDALDGLPDCVRFANTVNNHAGDSGDIGAMVRALEARNVAVLGPRNPDVTTADVGGTRVSFVSAWLGLPRSGLSYSAMTIRRLTACVRSAPGQIRVVCLHWGFEHVHAPAPCQRELARRLIDAGADVIIGHHPHVAQGWEVHAGKSVFYSLGNFNFWQMRMRTTPDHRFGYVVAYDLQTGACETIPYVINEDYQPVPLSGEELVAARQRLKELCRQVEMKPGDWYRSCYGKWRAHEFQVYVRRIREEKSPALLLKLLVWLVLPMQWRYYAAILSELFRNRAAPMGMRTISMMQILRGVYERCPRVVRRFSRLLPARVVYGRSYRAYRRSAGGVSEAQQLDILERTCVYAFDHCRFWRRHFAAAGFDPRDFSMEAFQALPTISSQTLKDHFDEIVSDEANAANSYLTSTGGSGLQPTPVRLSNASFGAEWAFMHHLWSEVGYRLGDRKLVLRGQSFGARAYRFNDVYNDLQLNLFHYRSYPAEQIARIIERFRPRFIHGYSSALLSFMWYLQDAEVRLDWHLTALLLGSQRVTAREREQMEGYFGAPVFNWYGLTEKVCLAGDCPKCDGYHVLRGYSFVEVIDEDGRPASKGEIVGTSFLNDAMPLIRYRTGDYGEATSGAGTCGWSGLVLRSIQGRWGEDFVLDSRGHLISTAALNLHGRWPMLLRKYQLHQDRPGHVTVCFEPVPGAETQVHTRLQHALQSRLPHCVVDTRRIDTGDAFMSHRGKEPLFVQSDEVRRMVADLRRCHVSLDREDQKCGK